MKTQIHRKSVLNATLAPISKLKQKFAFDLFFLSQYKQFNELSKQNNNNKKSKKIGKYRDSIERKNEQKNALENVQSANPYV